jgi:LEA14-like dessication related protein
MDAKKIIPIAIIGAGAYYVATRAFNTAQAVGRLKVVGFKVQKFNASPFNMSMDILLKVENPGSANIPLEYYTGSIIYNGATLSQFSFNGNGKNFSFKARGITEIPFTARISNIGAIAQVINLVKKIALREKVDTVFEIKSNLFAGGIDLPVNFSHDLKPSVV